MSEGCIFDSQYICRGLQFFDYFGPKNCSEQEIGREQEIDQRLHR